MPAFSRCIVLARSFATANDLMNTPYSPFIAIPTVADAPPLGGVVIGVRGLHKFGLGRVNKDRTLTVAWHLHTSDPAVHTVRLNIEDPDPRSVLLATQGMFAVPAQLSMPLAPSTQPSSLAQGYPATPSRSARVGGPPAAIHTRNGKWSPNAVFALVRSIAIDQGVAPALALAFARVESNFHPDALSPRGSNRRHGPHAYYRGRSRGQRPLGPASEHLRGCRAS